MIVDNNYKTYIGAQVKRLITFYAENLLRLELNQGSKIGSLFVWDY